MALVRVEINRNAAQSTVTSDDGSDASTKDLGIVYEDTLIDKADLIDHLDIIMRGIEQDRVTTAMSAGHTRWYLPKGGDVSDVTFDTSGSFTALDPSTEGDYAIELLPAGTNINAQQRGRIRETLELLKQYTMQNDVA
mgnify:CR=1 FL=1